jgi:ADP-ribose pyrophosphatase
VADIRDEPGAWPVRASHVLVRGHIVTVRRDDVELPSGELVSREVVEHPGAVGVIALDDEDRVLMIRQYRHPVGATMWEIPAGLRDVPGEPLVQTARRELLEETGYRATTWHVLADFATSPGITTERLRVFLARDLAMVPRADREYVPEHEEAYLTTAWVQLTDAVRAILAGELHNGVAIVGILSTYAAWGDGFRALRDVNEPETL